MFTPEGRLLEMKRTRHDGCAMFTLPAERVLVSAGDASATTTVLASDFTSVMLALEP